MRTSRDVVFDESCLFYPCPTTDASLTSLVDHLSFLLFSDAPPASLPISRSTLPSSMSSSESSPMVLDYTMKPPVTQFYSYHGVRLSDAPTSSNALFSDVSSSPPVEPSSSIDSSPEQLVRCNHCLYRPPDCYSPSTFTTTSLFEPTSYREAILHPEW
jgi:hypothetical protein